MKRPYPLGQLTWTADGGWNLNTRLSNLPAFTERGVPLRCLGIMFSIDAVLDSNASGTGMLIGDAAAVINEIHLIHKSSGERMNLRGVTLREVNMLNRGGRTLLDSAAIAGAAGEDTVFQRLLLDFNPPSADNPADFNIPCAILQGSSLYGTFGPSLAFRAVEDNIVSAVIDVYALIEPYPTAADGVAKVRQGVDWTLLEEHVGYVPTTVPISGGGIIGLALVRHNAVVGAGLTALADADIATVNWKADGVMVREQITDEELLALYDQDSEGDGLGSIEEGDDVRILPFAWPNARNRARDFIESGDGNHDIQITGDGGANTYIVWRSSLQDGAKAARFVELMGGAIDSDAPEGDPRLGARIGAVHRIASKVPGTR